MLDWLFGRKRKSPSADVGPTQPDPSSGPAPASPYIAQPSVGGFPIEIGPPITPGEWPAECAYAIWYCTCRTPGCNLCARLNEVHFLPEAQDFRPRKEWAQSGKGACRRDVVYVGAAENGASEIVAFLRSRGGTATEAELDAWEEAKMQKAREEGKRSHEMSDKSLHASNCEKDDPLQAMALYREVIAYQLEQARLNPDRWSWRDFPYLFNRLTLVLERARRWEEALEEISRWETLPDQDQSSKAEREAPVKRKARLQERISKERPLRG